MTKKQRKSQGKAVGDIPPANEAVGREGKTGGEGSGKRKSRGGSSRGVNGDVVTDSVVVGKVGAGREVKGKGVLVEEVEMGKKKKPSEEKGKKEEKGRGGDGDGVEGQLDGEAKESMQKRMGAEEREEKGAGVKGGAAGEMKGKGDKAKSANKSKGDDPPTHEAVLREGMVWGGGNGKRKSRGESNGGVNGALVTHSVVPGKSEEERGPKGKDVIFVEERKEKGASGKGGAAGTMKGKGDMANKDESAKKYPPANEAVGRAGIVRGGGSGKRKSGGESGGGVNGAVVTDSVVSGKSEAEREVKGKDVIVEEVKTGKKKKQKEEKGEKEVKGSGDDGEGVEGQLDDEANKSMRKRKGAEQREEKGAGQKGGAAGMMKGKGDTVNKDESANKSKGDDPPANEAVLRKGLVRGEGSRKQKSRSESGGVKGAVVTDSVVTDSVVFGKSEAERELKGKDVIVEERKETGASEKGGATGKMKGKGDTANKDESAYKSKGDDPPANEAVVREGLAQGEGSRKRKSRGESSGGVTAAVVTDLVVSGKSEAERKLKGKDVIVEEVKTSKKKKQKEEKVEKEVKGNGSDGDGLEGQLEDEANKSKQKRREAEEREEKGAGQKGSAAGTSVNKDESANKSNRNQRSIGVDGAEQSMNCSLPLQRVKNIMRNYLPNEKFREESYYLICKAAVYNVPILG